jgi:hypothetical protein
MVDGGWLTTMVDGGYGRNSHHEFMAKPHTTWWMVGNHMVDGYGGWWMVGHGSHVTIMAPP